MTKTALFLVAWFQLSKSPSQRDIQLSNECMSVTSATVDYRCVLGSVAVSRGLHYWEVTVDRHDGNSDIVVGVAQPSVNRQAMLGKDANTCRNYFYERMIMKYFLSNLLMSFKKVVVFVF